MYAQTHRLMRYFCVCFRLIRYLLHTFARSAIFLAAFMIAAPCVHLCILLHFFFLSLSLSDLLTSKKKFWSAKPTVTFVLIGANIILSSCFGKATDIEDLQGGCDCCFCEQVSVRTFPSRRLNACRTFTAAGQWRLPTLKPSLKRSKELRQGTYFK